LVFVDHVKTSDLVLQTNKLWENSEWKRISDTFNKNGPKYV
jgi:hypothetical protein